MKGDIQFTPWEGEVFYSLSQMIIDRYTWDPQEKLYKGVPFSFGKDTFKALQRIVKKFEKAKQENQECLEDSFKSIEEKWKQYHGGKNAY